LLLTIDAYDIEVRHRIGISQQFNVTQADIAKLPALAYIGAGGTVQYFTNGFNTKTKGVDVVGTYRFNIGPGRLATTLAYNYNKTNVSSYDPTVISQARIIDIQHYAPNNRVNLTLDYQLGPFAAVLHENYYGTFRDQNDYPGQLFASKTTTDLDLAYTVWRNLTVAVGGKNIFNVYPDKIANSSSNTVYSTTGGLIDGEVYPRTGGPFGFNGAFWYLRLAAKF
jgi:iron complex outermembrane recepter protein